MEKAFVQYLQRKNHTAATQKAYGYSVKKFLQWYQQDALNATKKDVLKYLEYLQTNRQQTNIATHLLQNGMSVESIALFLGHGSLDSTQIYTHLI